MPDAVIAVALVVCWGSIVVVWLLGALFNAVRGPHDAIRAEGGRLEYAGAVILCAVVAVAAYRVGRQYLAFGAPWVRAIGLVVLVVSTAFALWARLSLGTSWSVNPRVGGDRRLRTSGPYAITRHPIYTGLLGMLIGTALLGGLGEWLVLVVVAPILLEVKIRQEERLLDATFAGEYAEYRARVPQLVPGSNALRWRR